MALPKCDPFDCSEELATAIPEPQKCLVCDRTTQWTRLGLRAERAPAPEGEAAKPSPRKEAHELLEAIMVFMPPHSADKLRLAFERVALTLPDS
jgi:hypothetical protein